jgi:hypothetical protein
MARKPLARGDLIKVHWCDICEDPVGNPDAARPSERVSYGLFWSQDVRGPVECLTTTTTLDKDGASQSGFCIYPLGCVLKIEIIKRVPKI